MQKILNKLLKERVGESIGDKTYRDVPIAPVYSNLLYWKITKSPAYIALYEINEIEAESRLSAMVDGEVRKISFSFFTFIIGFGSIVKWIQHSFRKSPQRLPEVLINIDHKKYLKHSDGIFNEFKNKGVRVVRFVWDFANIKIKDQDTYPEKRMLPAFWKIDYWKFAQACWYIDIAYSACKRMKPRKIVVIEGDNYTHHIFGYLARVNPKMECICLQWGYVGTEEPKLGWQNMPYDKYLAWGEFFKNRYRQHNPDLNIEITGHPNLKRIEKSERNVILFALQKEMLPYVKSVDIHKFIDLAIHVANKFPQKKVRVRTHPHHPVSDKSSYTVPANFQWHEYDKYNLNDSFEDIIACLSICSTLTLEAAFSGALPIYLKIREIDLQVYRDAECEDTAGYLMVLTEENLFRELADIQNRFLTPGNNYFFSGGIEISITEIVKQIGGNEQN